MYMYMGVLDIVQNWRGALPASQIIGGSFSPFLRLPISVTYLRLFVAVSQLQDVYMWLHAMCMQ